MDTKDKKAKVNNTGVVFSGLFIALIVVLGSLAPFAFKSKFASLFPKDQSNAQVATTNQVNEGGSFPADIDGNGVVDVYDLGVFAYYYDSMITDSSDIYQALCDIEGNGRVDVYDLGIFAGLYGTDYLLELGPDTDVSPTPTTSSQSGDQLINGIDQIMNESY
ncbi:hypothetical protein HGA91_03700 [candidate division WWE3 bacterium]|nr:hypothetical protein [candidate division WWE3 bacterium]